MATYDQDLWAELPYEVPIPDGRKGIEIDRWVTREENAGFYSLRIKEDFSCVLIRFSEERVAFDFKMKFC